MASDSPAQYIHTIQHLIEKCLMFNMSKEECMEALSKHANIQPVVTSTVWKELEKENKDFFEAYTKKREENASELTDTTQRLHEVLLDSSEDDTKDG